jgi:hypothetical protein
MTYDPNVQVHRQILAVELMTRLDTAGFIRRPAKPGTRELVYARPIPSFPGVSAVVYTSIEENGGVPEVRWQGRDAIRCMALYAGKDDPANERMVAKADRRVFRTGEIVKIGERMIARLREVWRDASNAQRCGRCGAPTFVSKKGNTVCADLCFSKK